ncbi:MAG: MBL fold metallo-hydrolase [Silvanigrellales bacterium]|nr:MBL fold metallo-hydrolase [Silvanigrellales bacterium]
MKITFVGHQTWFVEGARASVLVDPVLRDRFGRTENSGFQVFPPRTVNASEMPTPSAVFISHEHSDHFDPGSLALLDTRIPVYLGALVIEPVAEVIRQLGFTVHRVNSGEQLEIEDLRVTFFAAGSATAYWESRVYQVYFESSTAPDDPFFIAVDALISEEMQSQIDAGRLVAPTTVAVSNNSQVTPEGVFGSMDNRRVTPFTNPKKKGFVGLGVLESVVHSYFKTHWRPERILICGCGFMKDSDDFGPFPFSDQQELAALANRLSLGPVAFGPLPGERYEIRAGGVATSRVPWIELDEARMQSLRAMRDRFMASGRSLRKQAVVSTPMSDSQKQDHVGLIEKSLSDMVSALMMSKLGRHLTSRSAGNDEANASSPLVVRLLDGPGGEALQWAFDARASGFRRDKTEAQSLLERFPFGVELWFVDFIAILQGEIQVWDIAGTALESWYACDEFEGPVPFFYSYFGENTSVELARKVYFRRLASGETP